MLELAGIRKRLGSFRLVDLSLTVQQGEYFVLMGPSGVGKTVLLELVCGVLRPDGGQIRWQGQDITHTPPEHRRFAVAYQDYALFPHMTAAGNIAYGLRARRRQAADVARRVEEVAAMLGIEKVLEQRPHTLSGGEQQRVALARAIITKPRLLLLDEPLSALHGGARQQLRHELERIHRQTGTTLLHVTHDPQDALQLADRVAVMIDRRVHQVGRPQDILSPPTDPEVAALIGVAEDDLSPA